MAKQFMRPLTLATDYMVMGALEKSGWKYKTMNKDEYEKSYGEWQTIEAYPAVNRHTESYMFRFRNQILILYHHMKSSVGKNDNIKITSTGYSLNRFTGKYIKSNIKQY